ncbi:SAM-dependent methyltransferase [Streptomyces malaysiensis]|uniref:SAM-dependent methyltransferase n=1 Tax=Streptomyces malaysiensis subsp. samsunensis TaxID=459658 RepID=A0A9X2LZH6_STRMQ|nr:SAM-dependent methyltransferase [Streptomyces samsunensis]MCQ8832371.1 SAM-dependent methyltransferase [Streptomyces samsunensis]
MERELVSLSDIKELAEVGRPTVTNWRRRHSAHASASAGGGRTAFPEPVGGTDAKPLFDAEEVASWLDRRPAPNEPGRPGHRTYGDRFRHGLRLRGLVTLRYEVGSGESLITSALALAAGHEADGDGVAVDLPDAPLADGVGVDSRVRKVMKELIAVEGPARAADRVLKLADQLDSDLSMTATPEPVARLTESLVGSVAGLRVIDLSADTGSMLLALPGLHRARAITAVEADPLRRTLLRYRLLAHGVAQGQVSEELEESGSPVADVVVADPPYAPVEREKDAVGPLHWAEHAVRLLAAEGRAYVLVPTWTLTRPRGQNHGPTVEARDRLLSRGHIETIVQLPRRVHPFLTGAEFALLVLRPAREPEPVLLVDADRIAQRPGVGWIDEVTVAVDGGAAPGPEAWHRVPVRPSRPGTERLLDGRSVLPAHRLAEPEPGTDHVRRVLDARRSAAAALPRLRDWLGEVDVSEREIRGRHRKLAEHLRAGQLRLLSGHRIKDTDIADTGLVVIGREEMLGELPVGRRRIALESLARYSKAATTEAGDVLLLTEHGVRSRVDETGGCVLLAPVQGLRIAALRAHRRREAEGEPVDPADLWMRPQTLAQLLQAPRNQRRSSGSLVRRVSVRDMDLPQVSGAEVAEAEAILSETERLRAEVRRQLGALDELSARLAAGLADGAVAVRRRAT